MKKSRRTYNGVHLNKKSNTQDVVEQSLTVHQATDIVTAYVIGIVICQAMKIAGTHVGKIAIYEETAGREHYGDEKKNPCWSM